jgi:transaldolase
MQLFIDSANKEEIKNALSWGIIDGITTNPSLIKKEVERLKSLGKSIDLDGYIKNLLELAGKNVPVSLEVTASDAAGMIEQGTSLFKTYNSIAGNVVVKIVMNTYVGDGFEGIKAINALSKQGIPVNATLIFTPEQALLAAKAGAAYVSPFAGRIDDYLRELNTINFDKNDYFPADGWSIEDDLDGDEVIDDEGIVSGVDLIENIVSLFRTHKMSCKIIAASLRNNRQVREVALAGATIATVPYQVLIAMTKHVKTKEGMEKFSADVVPEYATLLDNLCKKQHH